MNAAIAGRKIAAACAHSCILRCARYRDQLDLRSDSIPIALTTSQLQRQPMLCIAALVMKDVGRTVIRCNHDIERAIIIDVAHCQSPRRPLVLENLTRLRRNVHKFLSVVMQKKRWLKIAQMRKGELNRVQHVALRNEQVFPAIVIVVHELHAPARIWPRNHSQPGTPSFISEGAVS